MQTVRMEQCIFFFFWSNGNCLLRTGTSHQTKPARLEEAVGFEGLARRIDHTVHKFYLAARRCDQGSNSIDNPSRRQPL